MKKIKVILVDDHAVVRAGYKILLKNIDAIEDTQLIFASIPLAETFGYANTLRSLTQGRASFSLEFSAFEEAPKSVVEMQQAI